VVMLSDIPVHVPFWIDWIMVALEGWPIRL
jgi:hypothetical protein